MVFECFRSSYMTLRVSLKASADLEMRNKAEEDDEQRNRYLEKVVVLYT